MKMVFVLDKDAFRQVEHRLAAGTATKKDGKQFLGFQTLYAVVQSPFSRTVGFVEV